MSSSFLPNLVVAGFPKCGTTSLHELLVAAGARSTAVKEPGFLLRSDFDRSHLMDAYRHSFPRPAGLTERRIDATPWYVYDEGALSKVKAFAEEPLVILAVREHFGRVRSMYLDQHRTGNERRVFADAIVDSLDGEGVETPYVAATPGLRMDYVASSSYAPYIERWMRTFGPRVRLVALEQLAEPVLSSTLDALGDFVGLPVAVDDATIANAATGRRTAAGAVVKVTHAVGRLVPERIKPVVLSRAQPILSPLTSIPLPGRVSAPSTELPDDLAGRLEVVFRRDTDRLRALDESVWLGGPPSWLTDG